ncbi:MAG: hypothetical protein KAY55_01385 [Deltaproteobacteria bacterium]|nr:hypothetical protein [Deltaproteobacteria bacterium]
MPGFAPVLLDSRMALSTMRTHVRHTTLFVRTHPAATKFQPVWDALHTKVQKTAAKESELVDAIEEARVQVAVANVLLDGFVEEHRSTLRMLVKDDLEAPLYQRYYGAPTSSEVKRLSLEPQIKLMTPFVASMKEAKEAPLKALSPKLDKLLVRGSAALKALEDAQRLRNDFDAGDRAKLFDEVNGERRSLYGELCKLELADGTLSGLAEAAFRRRTGTSREEEADLQSLRERHSALKAEQTLVEQAIVQAEAQALLAAEEQKQREAAMAELLALEEQKKAVARREQELREALKPAKPAKSGSKRKK